MFGEPDVERLWDAVAYSVRLDEPDPVRPGASTSTGSRARCAQLDALELDAVRFRGPGTDLTVGLLPGSRWHGGGHDHPGRHRPRREPADRRGLHLPGLAPHRGHRPLDPAAGARRDGRPRPRGDVLAAAASST